MARVFPFRMGLDRLRTPTQGWVLDGENHGAREGKGCLAAGKLLSLPRERSHVEQRRRLGQRKFLTARELVRISSGSESWPWGASQKHMPRLRRAGPA